MKAATKSCFSACIPWSFDRSKSYETGKKPLSSDQTRRPQPDDTFWSPELNSSVPLCDQSNYDYDIRYDLAACFHLLDLYGMSEIIWNHASAKTPFEPGSIYINPLIMYDRIFPSNLLKVDSHGRTSSGSQIDNKTGPLIHQAIHNARPDINFIIHTHTKAGMAVSALKEGFIPLNQESAAFYERVGYHEWEGLVSDSSEQDRIVRDLGSNSALIMRNHGLLTVGRTMGEAFMLMYYLEQACQLQLDVLQTGREIHYPSPNVLEHTRDAFSLHENMGKHEWPALLQMLNDKGSLIHKGSTK